MAPKKDGIIVCLMITFLLYLFTFLFPKRKRQKVPFIEKINESTSEDSFSPNQVNHRLKSNISYVAYKILPFARAFLAGLFLAAFGMLYYYEWDVQNHRNFIGKVYSFGVGDQNKVYSLIFAI